MIEKEELIEDNIENNNLIRNIYEASRRDALFFFIGAGVSMNAELPSWDDYVDGMIGYWIANLYTLDNERKVDRSDLKLLRYLRKEDISNKLKVDLVYTLIEKYCMVNEKINQQLYEASIMKYNEVLFEKSRHTHDNDILENLVSLNSIFITSNYDNEIELAMDVKNRNYRTVDGIKNVRLNERNSTIIHIHGTANGNYNNFVLSSNSYTELYLNKKNEIYKNLDELIQEKESPVLIYVGSSLLEDEILNLISASHVDITLYALMKRSGMIEYDKLVKEYYAKKKSIKIIWYGEDYHVLPIYIKQLVAKHTDYEMKVFEKLDFDNLYLMKPIDLIDKSEYINVLMKIKSKNEYGVITALVDYVNENKENEVKLLNNVECLITIIDDENIHTNSLSVLLNFFFDSFSHGDKKLVLNHLEIKRVLFDSDYLTIGKSISSIKNPMTRYENAEKILKSRFQILNPKVLNENQTLRSLWFLNSLKKGSEFYLDDVKILKNPKYDWSEAFLKRFSAVLEEIDLRISFIELSTLGSNQSFNILVDAIKEKRIRKKEVLNLVEKHRSIQFALIFIDLEYGVKFWDDNLLKAIDWNDIFNGKILNKFVQKHKIELDEKRISYRTNYTDVIRSVDIKGNLYLPFLSIKEVLEMEKKSLINYLKIHTDPQSSNIVDGYFEEKNVSGQNLEFTNYLLNPDADIESKVFILNSLIGEDVLVENYIQTIEKSFEYLLSQGDEIIDVVRNFIENSVKTLFEESFIIEFLNIIENLFKKYPKEIPRILLILDNDTFFNKLSLVIEDEFISLTSFINSGIGNFSRFLLELLREGKYNIYRKEIEVLTYKFVESVNGGDIKYYLYGIFHNLNEYREKTPNVHYFIGLSHFYRFGANTNKLSELSESVDELLVNAIDDRYIVNNMVVVMVKCLDPNKSKLTKISKSKRDNSFVLLNVLEGISQIYFLSESEIGIYEEEWLFELMGSTKMHWTTIKYIYQNINDCTEASKEKFLNEYRNISFDKFELPENLLYYFILSLQKANEKSFLIKLLILIIEKKFKIFYSVKRFDELQKIIEFLDKVNEVQLIVDLLETIKNTDFITATEYKTIERKYRIN